MTAARDTADDGLLSPHVKQNLALVYLNVGANRLLLSKGLNQNWKSLRLQVVEGRWEPSKTRLPTTMYSVGTLCQRPASSVSSVGHTSFKLTL